MQNSFEEDAGTILRIQEAVDIVPCAPLFDNSILEEKAIYNHISCQLKKLFVRPRGLRDTRNSTDGELT